MPSPALSPEQEAEAQAFATRIQQAVDLEVLRMARLVVRKAPQELFGQTEFDLRDSVLRSGAKVYELYLAEKKTATLAPAFPARTAAKGPTSKATAPRRRSVCWGRFPAPAPTPIATAVVTAWLPGMTRSA